MVAMLDGTDTELGHQVAPALFGYLIGVAGAVSSFIFGRQVYDWLLTLHPPLEEDVEFGITSPPEDLSHDLNSCHSSGIESQLPSCTRSSTGPSCSRWLCSSLLHLLTRNKALFSTVKCGWCVCSPLSVLWFGGGSLFSTNTTCGGLAISCGSHGEPFSPIFLLRLLLLRRGRSTPEY